MKKTAIIMLLSAVGASAQLTGEFARTMMQSSPLAMVFPEALALGVLLLVWLG